MNLAQESQPVLVSRFIQSPIEVKGGADHGEVGKGLRDITKELTLCADLFGKETEVVAVAEHFLKEKTRFAKITRAGDTFDVPKGANRESAFTAVELIVEGFADLLAIDERIFDQILLDRLKR